ncbi:RNA polymerase sigma-70 factor [Formosa sediminum]|uniref:RNA polymerase sigma-70 factor n=1 Tax=Formosa sediminum TaxID=2594004 RepID=A0A516GUJ5_9FLAO|nr:RNA polymerase sigma-70 factor [Formosa sediminum]QDO95194.1 RNA polymerase sigma-70 factor [Formosa sediminum]
MVLHNYDNEDILINRLRAGDETAYKHLYTLYYSELCNYINTLSGSMDVSQDLVQQAFIKVWHKRESFTIEHSLKKYIFRIAYNLFIDLTREHSKKNLLIEQLKYQVVNDMVESPTVDFDKMLNLLITEVDKLPEQCKKVFLLGKKDGLKYREIAEELNISIKTVERHMTKALKRLRENLKDNSDSVFLIITYLNRSFFLKR